MLFGRSRSEHLQWLREKPWKQREKVFVSPYHRKVRIREDSFYRTIDQSYALTLHDEGSYTPFGGIRAHKRLVRTQWPPTQRHPVWGWRGRYMAAWYKKYTRRWPPYVFYVAPFTWKLLCAVADGKRPFSLYLLKKAENEIEASRSKIFAKSPRRRRMQITYEAGAQLGWMRSL